MTEFSVAELAERAGGVVIGDGTARVRRAATLEEAGPGDLSFIANARYLPYVQATRASALLVSDSLGARVPPSLTQIRVADPHAALATLLPLLYPPRAAQAGIHATAVVEEAVELGVGVSIGAYAVVGAGSRIGDRARIGAHVVVGAACIVGADSAIEAQATLYAGVHLGERCIVHSGARIGADGFGYVFVGGAHRKVPQVGGVRIGDDVEIGANAAIDRGSIGDTVVGRGAKIDNLVHLAHNVRVGEHAIITAQVGVAGSTEIGAGAVFGGQAGVGGHLRVGAGARVAGQAGVIGDVAAGETVSGYPARPHREALRAQAGLLRLPELVRRVQALERRMQEGRDAGDS